MIYCETCGAELPDSANYCLQCGTPTHKYIDSTTLPIKPRYDGFFSGRIGRERFFAGLGLSAFPLIALSLIFLLAYTSKGYESLTLLVIFFILLVPTLVFSISLNVGLTIRRCHDLGWNGIFAVFAYIPYVGPIFELFLLAKKGDTATNKYGPLPHLHKNIIDDIFNYDFHRTTADLKAVE